MKKTLSALDGFAISLSLLCAIHCLVLPIILVAMPSLVALGLQNEAFHTWMLIAVLPTSLYALTMGCKQHKRYLLLMMGCIGLALMVLAVVIGEHLMGEAGEKIMTLTGAGLVACGHYFNFRLCQMGSNSSVGSSASQSTHCCS